MGQVSKAIEEIAEGMQGQNRAVQNVAENINNVNVVKLPSATPLIFIAILLIRFAIFPAIKKPILPNNKIKKFFK